MNDPSNRQAQTSFNGFQTMLMVPGSPPGCRRRVYRAARSRVTHSIRPWPNDDRDFFVYTPPGYDVRRPQPYPVLYLLHGLGDDAERWMNGGAANHILDNLIAQRKAVPMIVVTPLGYGTSTGPAGGRTPENITGYTKILLEEVMPVVDKAYNVSRNREQRAIAGLSMGGAESLYVGLKNLDTFAWIGAFSSAPMLWAAAPSDASRGAGRGAGAAPQVMDETGLREDIPWARCESQFATADAVDRVRHERRPHRREPAIQRLAEIEGRGVHRTGSARHGSRLAALASEPD